MYGREFNCSSSLINVEPLGGNRYRATGCGEAVYQCIGAPGSLSETCVVASYPEHDEDSDDYTSVSSASDVATETPDARRDTKNGKVTVALDLKLEGALLKLRAAPDRHGDLVQLKLLYVRAETDPKDCKPALLINGQLFSSLEARLSQNESVAMLRIDVPRDVVQEFGTARQLALRACDRRWSLRPEQLVALGRFVDLYAEELAWKQSPTKGGTAGMLAPLGGWPEWKPTGDPPVATTTGTPLTAEVLFKQLSPSVFQIEALLSSGSFQGSAVAVTKTELLTSCHVIDGARKIIAKQGKSEHVVKVVRSDPKTDRCVLGVADPTFVPVRGVRAYNDLEVGEPVYTLGAPSGLELTLSNGIVSGLREGKALRLVQTTAPISPGSSGGGLFDAHGNVVGITSLVLVGRERLNQSLNFAVPADSFWKP
jgi:hypothetical protein